MTTLPPSASEPSFEPSSEPSSEPALQGVGSAFARLDARVQRWIWEQNWSELRDIQEEAIHAILDGGRDVIISSPTASGKTEAAFLPICSQLAGGVGGSVRALYVSPLKALINDQFTRIDQLCEQLDIPVHRWHGDVSAGRKHALRRDPAGILLITPESLEALFALRGHEIARLFAHLAYVVVDELHAFIGTERGRQTQSLLHRLETAIARRVPRIGLSATLGDMQITARALRPNNASDVQVITSRAAGQELKIQLRGYISAPQETGADDAPAQDDSNEDIAAHLFTTLRHSDNLIFPNNRGQVEMYADWLRKRCEAEGVPNVFLPHHGNLSKTLREEAEARLKDKTRPASLICTTTLELGIDVGSVANVAQIGVPPSVASLRQRVGRSGRRGEAATLRVYITEDKLNGNTHPQDIIRADLVQAIAAIRLMLARWTEPPPADMLHPSTLVQQTLSCIAQTGGAQAADLWHVLCGTGPFSSVTPRAYALFLRHLAQSDLLMQAADGSLLLGGRGERIVNNYHFYAAFAHSEEYRLVANGQEIGTLPVERLPTPGRYIIFAGQRWQVTAVDTQKKLILLTAAETWGLPTFDGIAGLVHDRVRQEMRRIYTSADVPSFLDAQARALLAEGRRQFTSYRLDTQPLVSHGENTVLFCWRGDAVLHTLAAQLRSASLKAGEEGHALTVPGIQPPHLVSILRRLAAQGPADAEMLLPFCDSLMTEKHDCYVPLDMLGAHYASRYLDTQGAWDALAGILATIQE